MYIKNLQDVYSKPQLWNVIYYPVCYSVCTDRCFAYLLTKHLAVLQKQLLQKQS